jgi:hypothetical protein
MTATAQMLDAKNTRPCDDPDPTGLRTRVVAQSTPGAPAAKNHVHDCTAQPEERIPEPWEVYVLCPERPIG